MPLGRHAPGLERGREQRAAVHAGQRPHAFHAVARSVEGGEQAVREDEIHQPHAGHHRDVAEDQIDEGRDAARLDYCGVVAQDRHRDTPGAALDALDLPDDALGQPGGIHHRLRHLHGLLQRDRAGEGLGRVPRVVELVGRDDPVASGHRVLGRLRH